MRVIRLGVLYAVPGRGDQLGNQWELWAGNGLQRNERMKLLQLFDLLQMPVDVSFSIQVRCSR